MSGTEQPETNEPRRKLGVIGSDNGPRPVVETEKICPLISTVAPVQSKVGGVQMVRVGVECKPDCAWWHEQSKRCSVRIIATGILSIKDEVKDGVGKYLRRGLPIG